MKIIHISDLHIGHMVNGIEREEEFYIFFKWFSQKVDKHKPDCIIIAGDIFDVYHPSNSAIKQYYDFLLSLKGKVKKVIVIGGNHDSANTLKAPKELLELIDVVVISGSKDDYYKIIEFDDFVVVGVSYLREWIVDNEDLEEGIKNIYQNLLKEAKQKYPNKKIITTAHLSVTNAQKDSEREIYIGTLESVSTDVFKGYDYVALGHIHKPQKIDNHIYYSGSVLPLSFKEKYKKKIILIENNRIKMLTIPSIRKFISLKGKFDDIITKLETIKNSFIEIELEEEVESLKLAHLKDIPLKNNSHIIKIFTPILNIEKKHLQNLTPKSLFESLLDKEDKEMIELFMEIEKEVDEDK